MSTAQEAPALIQYACERCKTRFVLPPSRRRLGFVARVKASGIALGRTLRFREGLNSTYDGARRQMLAKMDDDAYQSFVQSFKFCHECRQFVCSECWSNSRKTCLGCFAKATGTTVRQRPPFAPAGPSIPRPAFLLAPAGRRRRMRTDASILVMGAAVLLLAVELVFILPGLGRNNGATPTQSDIAIAPTDAPTDTPSIVPTDSPTAAPTSSPSPTATASPSPSATPSASPSESPSSSPTAKPTPVPIITPKPYPTALTITCGPSPAGHINCTWRNSDSRGKNMTWKLDSGAGGTVTGVKSVSFAVTDGQPHSVLFYVTFTKVLSTSLSPVFNG
jgi:hypothetical protein